MAAGWGPSLLLPAAAPSRKDELQQLYAMSMLTSLRLMQVYKKTE